MTTPSPAAVTQLLRAWSGGDEGSLEQLLPLVETELRRLARAYMARERGGRTLQPTALVNEAFLRLNDARHVQWQDRAHFMGIAARLMRRVLVDQARARGYQKRGADAARVTFTLSVEETAEILHLSTDTMKRDWRLAKLWLLRGLEGESVGRR